MSRPRKQYRIDRHPRRVNGKRIESVNYNIYFRDHLQLEHRIKGTPDRSTSEYIAQNIVAIVNLKASNQPFSPELRNFIESQPKKLRENLLAWGILDANTNAGFEPLMVYDKIKAKHSKLIKFNVTGGHVYHWQESMMANEYSKHHISECVAKVAKIVKGCQFIYPSDISGEKIINWLSDFRDKGKSIRTRNSYLTRFNTFVRWMLKTDRISRNPIQYLKSIPQTDKERPRRPLTKDEINRLITAMVDAGKHHGLTGYERSLVYQIALGTGLRYNEIFTLKRKDIVFGNEPCVTIQASNAKNRKADTLPLRPELVKKLEQCFTENLAMPHLKAFSGM